MRVISRKVLKDFYENPSYKDSKESIESWYYEARNANWKNPVDIKKHYGNASLVGNDRVVFNICGNKYRLIVKLNYSIGIIFIRFIGTHKEYDNINANEV
jgi:mRNA interferase HigB